MSNPKLALIPSGQKATKVYSVLPNNGTGDFTFARTGDATRVRKDGLIETVATDIPRLDWLNSDCPNLLIEAQATNLTTHNQDLTNADWIKFNNATVTANQIISPSGEYNADKILFGTGISLVTNNATVTNSASYVLSIYLKGDVGGEQIQLDFRNHISEGVSGTLFTLTNQWVRYSVSLTSNQTALGLQLRTPSLTESQTIYAWGGQLETGTTASSVILTTGSTTRNADVCVVNPPSGVVSITETYSDNTTNVITTIPVNGELVTNGDFATDSDWTKGTGWTISGGSAVAAAGSASYLNQDVSGQSGKKYMVKIDVVRTAGSVFVFFGQYGSTFVTMTSSGSYTFINDWTANSNIGIYKAANFVGSVDNVSVKELYQINNGRIKKVIMI